MLSRQWDRLVSSTSTATASTAGPKRALNGWIITATLLCVTGLSVLVLPSLWRPRLGETNSFAPYRLLADSSGTCPGLCPRNNASSDPIEADANVLRTLISDVQKLKPNSKFSHQDSLNLLELLSFEFGIQSSEDSRPSRDRVPTDEDDSATLRSPDVTHDLRVTSGAARQALIEAKLYQLYARDLRAARDFMINWSRTHIGQMDYLVSG